MTGISRALQHNMLYFVVMVALAPCVYNECICSQTAVLLNAASLGILQASLAFCPPYS